MTFLPTSTPTFSITPDDVALLRRRLRADDEVRAAQDVDVQRVVLQHEGVIDQFADLAGGGRRLDLVEVVERLGRGHVMRRGAHAADAAGDLRHLLGRSAVAEDLEAAQLRDLQIRVLHVALVVEEDVNLAVPFEAGDGVNRHVAARSGGGSMARGRELRSRLFGWRGSWHEEER